MQPLGRKKVKFPGKRKEWLGKKVKMWWEVVATPLKRSERNQTRREIEAQLAQEEMGIIFDDDEEYH